MGFPGQWQIMASPFKFLFQLQSCKFEISAEMIKLFACTK